MFRREANRFRDAEMRQGFSMAFLCHSLLEIKEFLAINTNKAKLRFLTLRVQELNLLGLNKELAPRRIGCYTIYE
jgi:hypothetical protein